jgi:leader peptidase (prepilin peptidase)/N-methyltransferase
MNDAPSPALEATFVTLLGLFLGSFMNVCIYRLPRGRSPVRPRSGCPKCGHMLAWYENVPVLSYLVLRGKCRSCGTSISPMYPIIESITGAMFLAGYLWYGPSALLVIRLLFGCAMIVLFVIDLEHKILPNVITLPGIVVGFLLSEVAGPGWLPSLIGIAVGAGSLFAIAEIYYRVRHEEGLGMGDVKMLGMIGAFLGWKLVLVTLVLSSIAGSIVGVGVLIAKKETLKYALPFGTFLAVGALVAAVAGDSLVNWYLQFYR